jgi:hypothetical protein
MWWSPQPSLVTQRWHMHAFLQTSDSTCIALVLPLHLLLLLHHQVRDVVEPSTKPGDSTLSHAGLFLDI